jgi:hypothetical protein
MDPVLDHPSTHLDRSPEDMLRDLEALVDEALQQADDGGPAVKQRYERELAPLLHDARTAVAQEGLRAKQVLDDAVHRFRAFLATSRLHPSPAGSGVE